VKIIEQKNEGQASAFYSGAREVQKNFICLLDSDDYFHTNKAPFSSWLVFALKLMLRT
jgi:glycosyltransferase involved in cell wall biosynthesis